MSPVHGQDIVQVGLITPHANKSTANEFVKLGGVRRGRVSYKFAIWSLGNYHNSLGM